MSGPTVSSSLLTRAVTVVVLGVLSLVLLLGLADKIDARLVGLGEELWPGYASQLRLDPEPPICDLDQAQAALETCIPDHQDGDGDGDGGDGELDDPFAEPGEATPAPGAVDDPFAEPAEPAGPAPAQGAVDDPFAEPAGAEAAVDDPFGAPAEDDPFAEPAAGGGDDPFADPFAEPGDAAPRVSCAAAQALVESCTLATTTYEENVQRLTAEVKRFRSVELLFARLADFPYKVHLLSFVLLMGGLQVTWVRAHIALLPAVRRRDHLASQVAQLVSNLLLAGSSVADYRIRSGLDVKVEELEVSVIWAVGFGVLALLNVYHLLRAPTDLEDEPPTVWTTLASVPLFAYMVLLSGAYFLLVEGHPSGQAIYLFKFAQLPAVYLAVALYVWAGMLLHYTRLAPQTFDILRPWKLPPALLSWVVVVLAAIPTAYSGASGIFVIAAGAVVFDEMRRAGASRQVSILTTAMSGSLGVVLQPCLVVVLIAALNKQVTTAQLFDKGVWVFALSAVVFLAAVLLTSEEKLRPAPVGEALPAMARELVKLVPYVLVGGAIVVFFDLLLETPLDERNAPQILPLMLLAVLAYERFRKARAHKEVEEQGLGRVVFGATSEATHHVGALLFLMVATVCLGGVVERMEVMNMVPADLGSRFTTMSILLVMMVLIGMTMDAMGAVILVSVSLATVAYDGGIDPVHFWMMVLVAFELGYLTPPVALNQLLTRAVVGKEAFVPATERKGGFFGRHKHILLPVAVMATVLLLVAYVPLAFY